MLHRVRFHGAEYVFSGSRLRGTGILLTPEAARTNGRATARVYADGEILAGSTVIGTWADLEVLGEVTDLPTPERERSAVFEAMLERDRDVPQRPSWSVTVAALGFVLTPVPRLQRRGVWRRVRQWIAHD